MTVADAAVVETEPTDVRAAWREIMHRAASECWTPEELWHEGIGAGLDPRLVYEECIMKAAEEGRLPEPYVGANID